MAVNKSTVRDGFKTQPPVDWRFRAVSIVLNNGNRSEPDKNRWSTVGWVLKPLLMDFYVGMAKSRHQITWITIQISYSIFQGWGVHDRTSPLDIQSAESADESADGTPTIKILLPPLLCEIVTLAVLFSHLHSDFMNLSPPLGTLPRSF